jgi:hypothetical protein
MSVEAVLINSPAIDFTTFLSLAYEAMGYNLAGAADASHKKLTDPEKFLSCLAALKDQSGEITPKLLPHVAFGVLVVAEERDLPDILDMTSGMSFVRAMTVPNVEIVVISGTLLQWRHAVAAGTNEAAPPIVRTCYSKILMLFDRAGLTSTWNDFERRMAPDHSGFLLEDNKQGRTY